MPKSLMKITIQKRGFLFRCSRALHIDTVLSFPRNCETLPRRVTLEETGPHIVVVDPTYPHVKVDFRNDSTAIVQVQTQLLQTQTLLQEVTEVVL